MTVKELIEKLKEFPDHFVVECSNYDEDIYGNAIGVHQSEGPNWDLDQSGCTTQLLPCVEIEFKFV